MNQALKKLILGQQGWAYEKNYYGNVGLMSEENDIFPQVNDYADKSKEILNLLKENKEELTGGITLTLGKLTIDIESKDSVGDLIQEWLFHYLKDKGINIYVPYDKSTQEFPDYYLEKSNEKNNLLEVKTFNYNNGPGFDLANFDAYCKSLYIDPQRLYADYIILGYTLVGAKLKIEEIWLKKIWELTGNKQLTSKTTQEKYPNLPKEFPINLQIKKSVIVNIRPYKWYSEDIKDKKMENEKEFVEALYWSQEASKGFSNLSDFKKSYKDYYEKEFIENEVV